MRGPCSPRRDFNARRTGMGLALALSTLLLAGCLGMQAGPKAVSTARFDYSEAVNVSWRQQLVLNLVRLRYRDSLMFLDLNSIVAQYSLDRSAGAGAGVKLIDGGANEGSAALSISGTISEKPVFTFVPLQGEAFTQRFLSPFDPATLVLLSGSGWSIERLLLSCVQEMNGIRNAVPAGGPTPDYVPEYETFHRAAFLLRKLQVAGLLVVEADQEGKVFITIRRSPDGSFSAENDEVRRILTLQEDREAYPTRHARGARTPLEIASVGRSLVGTMYFLSQGVEAPEEDERKGRVTVTRTAAGERFDWSRIVGPLLRIRSSEKTPADAYVAVPYRGHWFWVADDDLNSKTTLSLLGMLVSLKSGNQTGASPLLTVGGR